MYFVLQTSKYRVTGRAVEFECKKVGSGQIWPRLAEKPGKLSWLKTDFDHLAFEDSDGSSEDDLTVRGIQVSLSLLFIWKISCWELNKFDISRKLAFPSVSNYHIGR